MARYPTYRRRRSGRKRWLAWFVFLAAIAAGLVWMLRSPSDSPANPEPGAVETAERMQRASDTAPVANDTHSPLGSAKQRAQAKADYDEGMQSYKDLRLIQARGALSRAMLSGFLDADSQKQANKCLSEIADKTIFSRNTYEDDPYVGHYTFQRGDLLVTVVKKLGLRVPWQILGRINEISNPRRIHESQALKILRGPFHAIVYKDSHLMDFYLQPDDMEKVFVRRVRVGLGKHGTTPLGAWRVKERLEKARYYPAANSRHKQPIDFGKPDYPLGKRGIWIGLQGTDKNTRNMLAYGIHGTNEPESIGGDRSEGCIRLTDKDIDLAYAMLTEKWSTITIRP